MVIRAVFLLLLGCGLLAAGVWGLWMDIAWIAQPFYAYAWWGVIFLLDGFCAARRGHSLLTSRLRLLPALLLWSVSFWFFFELLNVRFQNWYYVGVVQAETLPGLVACGLFAVLCFGTVFVGIFEMHEALTAAGLGRRLRGRRAARLPAMFSYLVQAAGLLMAAAAILWPHYLAPLIWGSFTFIIDPWNYRRGSRSILRDLEMGDYGVILRIFTAGLLCGLLWEGLNFFAPQKWIYTVRGLEGLKLFEMPLAGFLGFPALAFDCMTAYSTLSSLFLGNEPWEHSGDILYTPLPRPRPPRAVFWAVVPLHVVFWAAVSLAMTENIGSLEATLRDLGLAPRERSILAAKGILRPLHLLRAAREPGVISSLAAELRWDRSRADEILERADLVTFKGIGGAFAGLLERAGIRRVDDLRGHSPALLHARLEEEAERLGMRAPRLEMVRVWILASRDRGIFLAAEAD